MLSSQGAYVELENGREFSITEVTKADSFHPKID